MNLDNIRRLWTPTPSGVRYGGSDQTANLESILDDLVVQTARKTVEDRIAYCPRCGYAHSSYCHDEHPADHGFLLDSVRVLVDMYGLPITFDDMSPCHGMTDSYTITLDRGQSDGSKAHVLLHELTHVVAGIWPWMPGFSRTERAMCLEEVLAESTAYVTATALGLPTPFSAGYLSGYATSPHDFDIKRHDIIATADRFTRELSAIRHRQALAIEAREERVAA